MNLNYTAIITRIAKLHMNVLSTWERDFIKNVEEWNVIREKELTKPQKEVIKKINNKCLGKG